MLHEDTKRVDVYQRNENQNPLSVENVQLIKIKLKKGSGIESDPVRNVDVYYDSDGKHIFTRDSLSEDV